MLNGRYSSDKNIGHFTRSDTTGNSVVDYTLINVNDFNILSNFQIGNKMPESDHLPVLFNINIKQNVELAISVNDKCTDMFETVKNKQYRWSQDQLSMLQIIANDTLSRNAMSNFRDSIASLQNVDDVSDLFVKFITQAADRTFEVKSKSVSKGSDHSKLKQVAPWFDSECREARKLVLSQGKPESDPSVTLELCKNYRAMKQRKKRQFRRSMYNRLENCNVYNNKSVWDVLKPYRKNNISNTFSLEEFYNVFNQQALPSENSEWDTLYEDSVKSFLVEYENGCLDNLCNNNIMHSVINDNFTIDEISSVVASLKRNKSAGADGIHAEFLVALKDNIIEDLTLLFNYIIEHRTLPESWALGLRIPVPKINNPKNVNNFRQITILPVISKIFEIAILRRFSFINESFNLVDPCNNGFLRGARTADNILILLGSIQSQLAKRKNLYVCFVDFSRAFDLINRSILFYKLIKSGYHGRVIDTLRNMYSKTKARVKLGTLLSPIIENSMGVNQGGILSPFLFRKYLSDMSHCFSDEDGIIIGDEIIKYILWADDLVILAETPEGLQRQIDKLYSYCLENQLIVNTLKTKIMIYGSRNDNDSFHFNNSPVEITDSYKYLGVLFSPCTRLSGNPFKSNTNYIADKASKSAHGIFGYSKVLGRLPVRTSFALFDSLVKPIIEYGSEIWGAKGNFESIEKVHLRFIKTILGVKLNTSTLMCYGDCGRFPMQLAIQCKVIKYLVNLNHKQESNLVSKVYQHLIYLDSIGKYIWVTSVKNLFKNCKLALLSIDSIDDSLYQTFKETLHAQYIGNWMNSMANIVQNPIVRSYVCFKDEFRLESYLFNINDFNLRNVLSKFRLSSHSLEIESGRHKRPKTPVENRLCTVCDLNIVEDEVHFLLECPLYNKPRKLLFDKVSILHCKFYNISKAEKFSLLLNSKSAQINNWLAKTIKAMFNMRTLYLQKSA